MSSENPDTRTRILQAALDLLQTERGKGVRMADIAKRAGVTRQAVYLHFSTRAELLIAATRYVDELNDIDERLAPSRASRTGAERLSAFIEAWGGYIPVIYGIASALIALSETDEAAAVAWDNRMQAMREGCEAAINALAADGALSAEYTPQQATDLLWTLLSVGNWENLTTRCNWPQDRYVESLKRMTRQLFVAT